MINLARVKAVMIKERQDIGKNSNILVMYFLPILMTLIWSRIIPNMPQGFALGFGLLLLVVMVGMYVPSMMIAEEKEKNTIEVLLLSPATPAEVFIGKGALTIILMFFTSIILIIIGGVEIRLLPVILVGTILTSIFSVFLGMVVGILSPNQMATGVIGMPVYLLLLLIPQLSVMGVKIINQIGKFLPTYYYFELLRLALEKGQGWSSMLTHFLIIIMSIVITFIVLLLVYRRKGFS